VKQDHYTVLGVARDATFSQIKDAYRLLAKELHPDSNQDRDTTPQMQAVNEAYEVLSDPIKRKAFDEETQPKNAMHEAPAPRTAYRDDARHNFEDVANYNDVRDDAWNAKPADEQYAEMFEDEGIYDEPIYTNDLRDSKPPSLAKHALTQGFWCLFWLGSGIGCFYAPDMVTKPFRAASNRGEVIAPLGAGVLAVVLYVASLVCAFVGIAQLFKPRSRD